MLSRGFRQSDATDWPESLGFFPSEACTVCTNLRRAFTSPDFNELQAEGPFETVLAIDCAGHGPLFNFLRAEFRQDLKDYKMDALADDGTANNSGADAAQKGGDGDSVGSEDQIEDDEGQESLWNGRDLDCTFGSWELSLGSCPGDRAAYKADIWMRSPVITFHRVPLLATFYDEPETPGYGRILDPHWVDLELARRWKRDCLSQHQHKCNNPLRITAVSPAWVIDTGKNCIVPGTSISEYVALSYRWGVSAGFRTTSDILKALQEPGALSPGSKLGDSMAPILQHSMGLTQAIDERYLWVDAVCIVQDDEAHFVTEIGLMGAIYATAKLTIVAADGDAVEGILGLKGISPPRHINQNLIHIFDAKRVIFPRRLASRSGISPYFERGWTYQEFHLSQRRLTFAEGRIHWHCSCADWEEELIPLLDAETGPRNFRFPNTDHALTTLARQPDFPALNHLVAEYNGRHLSFPEDALPAISGLLSILGRSFEGGFLFGLPETVFDSALMWRFKCAWDMKKRQTSGKKHLLATAPRLPSWSWVSWKGAHFSLLEEETFSPMWPKNSRTIPITKWFTHKSPECDEKRPIHSGWLSLHEKFKDGSCELPEGWAREDYDKEIHRRLPEGLGPYVYRHAAIPDQYFWLPVPITTLDREIDLIAPAQTPYISCNTRRGWFAAAQYPIGNFTGCEPATKYHLFQAALLDDDGQYCGRLYLQDAGDILGFPEAASEQTCQVELVAICRRREKSYEENSWRLDDGEIITKKSYKDVYGILWVQWIDGIAYRRASGLIDKDSWEAHALEDIHLIMG